MQSSKEDYIPLVLNGPSDLSGLSDKDEDEEYYKFPIDGKLSILRLRGCIELKRVLVVALLLETVLVFVLGTMLWWKHIENVDCQLTPSLNTPTRIVYSPAEEAIQYETKIFSPGFGRYLSIYGQPPSDEVDAAWSELYDKVAFSRIPKDQARLLPNKTLPIPNDDGHYIVGLSVFHQLHCLNLLRRGLYADYYTDPVTGAIGPFPADEWEKHMGHCIDDLRQYIMCHSDVSTSVWQWNSVMNKSSVRLDTVRTCRNFDKVKEWAEDHRMVIEMNPLILVEDNIVIPVF